MITFSQLGNCGRLGNQLFQIACLNDQAKRLNTTFFLNKDVVELELLKKFNLQQLERLVWVSSQDYKVLYDNNIKYLFREKDFQFDSSINSLPDNVDLYGYFQSKKYFENSPDFLKVFDISLKTEKNICAVHVRRGDYVDKSNYHSNLAETDYYQVAMEYIKKQNPQIKFMFFSDDNDFCLKNFGNIEIFDGDTFQSLKKILECDYSIIANSSFSWWGSQLNKVITVAPKNWFGKEGPSNYQDVYNKNWIII